MILPSSMRWLLMLLLGVLTKAVYWVGAVVYFATVYFLITWVMVSFSITYSGPIRWGDGFERTKQHFHERLAPHREYGLARNDNP